VIRALILCLAITAVASTTSHATSPGSWPVASGDAVFTHVRFGSGESLADVHLHYRTLGAPRRDPAGHVRNAVLLLHGTGGDGTQFLQPQFAGELFGPGQPLDINRYFIILPDEIGHGGSSKPSEGLHARFPRYDYADMVALDYRLLTERLNVDHVRLILGTSMGCMHTFMFGETYPAFADALMPLACLPVPLAGRNRAWRQMTIDAVKADPAWLGGEYKTEPVAALRTIADLLLIAGSAPIQLQKSYPTTQAASDWASAATAATMARTDVNDFMYQIDASRTYDPSGGLGRIKAPVMWVNSADDFINPPELAIAEAYVGKIPHASFVLIPASEHTHGHGTHTWAGVWKGQLIKLLARSR